MGLIYLGFLTSASICLLLLDRRFRLFFWRDPLAAAVVSIVGVAFFLVWDLAGISLGIFFRGEGAIASGILLAPHLPLEEPVFLFFLVLCTMVLYTGSSRALAGRRTRTPGAAPGSEAAP
ncbi:MAG: lycopene cyclase domain-containing protein [Microbacterium sp.]|uniref:lycopene cyclase domain-containing protein n=1 Tax=Microbacterium sp. TaxID=51671 RepID=UPI003BAEEAD3